VRHLQSAIVGQLKLIKMGADLLLSLNLKQWQSFESATTAEESAPCSFCLLVIASGL